MLQLLHDAPTAQDTGLWGYHFFYKLLDKITEVQPAAVC